MIKKISYGALLYTKVLAIVLLTLLPALVGGFIDAAIRQVYFSRQLLEIVEWKLANPNGTREQMLDHFNGKFLAKLPPELQAEFKRKYPEIFNKRKTDDDQSLS